MDFDPNSKMKPNAPEWATYIPNRRPSWKVHSVRGHALSAAKYRSNYILYKRNGENWDEIWRIENGIDTNGRLDNCILCDKELREKRINSVNGKEWLYFKGHYKWLHNPIRRVAFCDSCKKLQKKW